jgi:hypothetical protein
MHSSSPENAFLEHRPDLVEIGKFATQSFSLHPKMRTACLSSQKGVGCDVYLRT